MKEKNNFVRKLYSLFLVVISIGLLCFFIVNQSNTYEKSMQNRAKYLIKEIDQYRKETGKLPDTLSEITKDKQYNEIFILENKDNNQYILRFQIRNNCDKVYDSEQQIWLKDCHR
ncbi:MAG: hypothetical protein LBE13_19030 [Bacteroidales bacterium]|jgi:hypothetical protein|nr:hypothetical protein [Bacteroidales bacterium]